MKCEVCGSTVQVRASLCDGCRRDVEFIAEDRNVSFKKAIEIAKAMREERGE